MSDSTQPEGTNVSSQPAANPSHGRAEGHDEDIEEHIRMYVLVFIALGVLTVLTVGVAYLDMPLVPAVITALLIATVKGGLVAGYFMHLITEEKIIYVVLVFTAVFMIAMLILMFSSIQVHRAGVP